MLALTYIWCVCARNLRAKEKVKRRNNEQLVNFGINYEDFVSVLMLHSLVRSAGLKFSENL